MTGVVDATTLRQWLHDGDEIAVLDVRDGGPYSRSHILVASSAPLAQLETAVPALVPRRSTRTVLVDDGDNEAARAAGLMERAGYGEVHVLGGGNPAWESAGFLLFSGSGIISKAFGEMVEHVLDTPAIDADTLAAWQRDGTRFHLFDSRPVAEYRTVSLPGATDCPGAELVYRVPHVVPDPNVPVVVNCAGRTRSIIGAQSLRDAGLPNPVYALRNGTMGWQLAGFDTVHGASNVVPPPGGSGLEAARELAAGVRARSAIRTIDADTLRGMLADTARTTYLFDVRQADEFERGHVPGSTNAAGGQLVQATDTFVAVRNARIVLIDEHMVQSVMTAHWLSRMGWDVSVLRDAAPLMTETGAAAAGALFGHDDRAPSITPEELSAMLAYKSCTVVDVGESYWYRQGRIPGSWYAMRSQLHDALGRFDRGRRIVFCCTSGSVAPYAAGDALALGFTDVAWLMGGRNGWRRAGHPVETIGDDDDEKLLTATDDMWYPPWARKEGVTEAMMQYLTWEVGLLETVSQETYVRFSLG